MNRYPGKLFLSGLAVIILLFSGCTHTVDFSAYKDYASSSQNIAHGGGMAEDGENVYYIKSEGGRADLYAEKKSGKERHAIARNCCGDISAVGGWIYYTAFRNVTLDGRAYTCVLYRVNKNGGIAVEIADTCFCPQIYHGRIYYYDDIGFEGDAKSLNITGLDKMERLYSMDMDGKDKKALNIKSTDFTLANGKIIYADPEQHGSLYAADTDGNSKTLIHKGSVSCFFAEGDSICYNVGGSLYGIRTDGSDKRELAQAVDVSAFYLFKQDIYYADSSGNIYKQQPGGGKIKCASDVFTKVYALGDGLYYLNQQYDIVKI